MSELDKIRRAFPDLQDASDAEVLGEVSRLTGSNYESVADVLGVKPRGTLAETGRQIGAGFAVDLPRMVGQGLKYTGLAPELGQDLVTGAEERAYGWQPDLRGRGLVGEALVTGGRAIGPMAPAIAASFVPGGQVVAPTVAAGLFGTSSAQETVEKLRKQGVPEEDVQAAAARVGLIQGPLEGLATYTGLKAFGAARPLLGLGATTSQVAGSMTTGNALKSFGKAFGTNLLVQPGTEVIQDTATEGVERAYGAAPEDLGEIARSSALGGLGLTLLLGPLSIGGHVSRARRAEELKAALYDPNTPTEVRAQAMDMVMAEATRQNVAPQDIDTWFESQLQLEDARNAELTRLAELRGEAERNLLIDETIQPLAPLQQRIDLAQGLTRTPQRDYESQFTAADQEPSGQFVQDPQTGIERELTMGEYYAQLQGLEPPAAPTAAGAPAATPAAPVAAVDPRRQILRDTYGIVPTKPALQLVDAIEAEGLALDSPVVADVINFAAQKPMSAKRLEQAIERLDKAIIDSRKAPSVSPTPVVRAPAPVAPAQAAAPVVPVDGQAPAVSARRVAAAPVAPVAQAVTPSGKASDVMLNLVSGGIRDTDADADERKLTRRMVDKIVDDGLAAGNTNEQILDRVDRSTDGKLTSAAVLELDRHMNARRETPAPAPAAEQTAPDILNLVFGEQDADIIRSALSGQSAQQIADDLAARGVTGRSRSMIANKIAGEKAVREQWPRKIAEAKRKYNLTDAQIEDALRTSMAADADTRSEVEREMGLGFARATIAAPMSETEAVEAGLENVVGSVGGSTSAVQGFTDLQKKVDAVLDQIEKTTDPQVLAALQTRLAELAIEVKAVERSEQARVRTEAGKETEIAADTEAELEAPVERAAPKKAEAAPEKAEGETKAKGKKKSKEEKEAEAEELSAEGKAARAAADAKLAAESAAKRSADRKGLVVGDTVMNPKLGTGVVKSFAGDGDATTVTVEFQSGQTKELSVKLAKLEKTDAVQKPSAAKVPVRDRAEAGQRDGAEDAQGAQAAREGQAQAAQEVAPATEAAVPDAVTKRENTLLQGSLDKLPEAQVEKLEKHYGETRGTDQFMTKLRSDVVDYINKGAEAVAGAVRSIIKSISEGVLAVGIVFNPNITADQFAFSLPASYSKTVDVRAEVPAAAAGSMSDLAKSVYERMAPVAKESGKAFIIADKPNGMLHAFNADGTVISQDSALYGKDMGDVMEGPSSLEGGKKVTPAGTFSLMITQDATYEGGYRLDLKETYDGGYIAIHAAYTGNKSEKRLERLKSTNVADKRVSFGCINTSHDAFLNDFLPNIDKFNGGMAIVLPDNQSLAETMFEGTTEEVQVTTGGGAATTQQTTDVAFKDETGPILENVERLASEPSAYTSDRQRAPSLTRGIATLRRLLDAGKITPEQFTARTEMLHDQVQQAKEDKAPASRQRGADFIRQRLLEAKRRGDLSERAVGMAEWFIQQNPALVSDLAVSIRGKGEDGVSGNYDSFRRLMTLMKDSANDETTVHEILHHLERMMPANMQAAIRKSWMRSLTTSAKAANATGDKNLIAFYDHLLNFHAGDGGQSQLTAAIKMIKDGRVSYSHYQHVNPSEFWAVRGSRILEGRYDVSGSMSGRVKQWLKEFVQKAKALFGLKSDAAVLRALDSLAKGDGKFVTGQQMLMQGVEYNILAGRRSLTAQKAVETADLRVRYATAKLLDSSGESVADIWAETGWYKNPVDNNWRYEIPDTGAQFKENRRYAANTEYELGDVFDHDLLYKAYPQFKEYKVEFDRDLAPGNASFDQSTKKIMLSWNDAFDIPTLLHELQHAVQQVEGFPNGGNPSATLPYEADSLRKLRAAKEQDPQFAANSVDIETLDRLISLAQEFAKKRDALTQKYSDRIDAVVETNPASFEEALADPELTAIRAETDVAKAEYSAAYNDLLQTAGWHPQDVAVSLYKLIAGELEAEIVAKRAAAPQSETAKLPLSPIAPESQLRVGDVGLALSLNLERPTTSTVEKNINALLPPVARKPVRGTLASISRQSSKALDYVVFTSDLINRAVDVGVKSAKQFGDLLAARATKAREMERDVERIADLYTLVPESDRGTGPNSVNQFIFDSTREGKWGYDTATRKADPEMEVRFNNLKPESQNLVRAMFEYGDKMLALKKKTVLDTTASEYDALIAASKAAGDTVTEARQIKEKADTLKRFKSLFAIREGIPYAPIKRTGDHVVVAKSAEYVAAEEAGDTAKLEKLQANGDHYHVSFTDTAAQARTLREQLEDQGAFGGGSVDNFERETKSDVLYAGESTLKALTALRNKAEAEASEGDKSSAKLLSIISQLYLEALADGSARKSEMKRRGVAGEVDMLSSFALQGRADANFLASLEFNPQVQDTLQKMRRERDLGGNRDRKSQLFNELAKRYEGSLETPNNPWLDKLTRASSIYYLATSPAYYLQNLTQPFMMSLPAMAGNHDYTKAATELAKAYGQLGDVIKSVKLGNQLQQQWDFSKVPADVREAIMTLADRGRIDIGLDTELGEFRVEGEGAFAARWNKIDKALRTMVQKAEAINRLSTAMAAYRLELAKTKSPEAALDYADRILQETHGDYSRFNAPRAFNTPVGKVALQFRKFQLIQLTFYAKLINDALTGKDRAVALKTLGYALGHTAVLAGTMGLPGYAAISWALGSILGSDDEEFDLTDEIRKAIGDEDLATMILRGAPTVTGMDISGKVGAGTMLSIMPFSNADLTTRSGVYEAAGTVLTGASGGMLVRGLDGAQLMLSGDFYKGLELLMPKGVSDAMKSYRIADEGMTRRNGDVILPPDEVNSLDAVFQALGIAPVKQTVVYEKRQRFQDMTANFTDRTTRIKNNYVAAMRKGDTAAAAEAREAWKKLQDAKVKNGLKRSPLSDLLKAPREQQKRERNTRDGIQFNRSTQRAAEEIAER